MLVVPSPKFQAQVVTWPVVVLVKATFKGAVPIVGLALKAIAGAPGALTLTGADATLLADPPGPVALRTTV